MNNKAKLKSHKDYSFGKKYLYFDYFYERKDSGNLDPSIEKYL